MLSTVQNDLREPEGTRFHVHGKGAQVLVEHKWQLSLLAIPYFISLGF